MKNIFLKEHDGIKPEAIKEAIIESIADKKGNLNKVLLLPPDATRLYSYAGVITNIYYEILKDVCQVDIMPALGTHMAINDEERLLMFGDKIPKECFLVHNWRDDVVKIGEVPADFVKEVSEGLMDQPIYVEVNKALLDKSYDLIISIGQVVPHEVVGLANYSKNIFVGVGGKSMIDKSHMLGAIYNLEKIMGRDITPVRQVFDYAQENFVKDIPLRFVLTVTKQEEDGLSVKGLYIGEDRECFTNAAKTSQEYNITFLDNPVKKVVAYLEPEEFKSTWIGNKAIYRSRLAIADGGELVILAPGVRQFGEDMGNDRVIRKYGYIGDKVLKMMNDEPDLLENQSVTAHLMHGYTFGRFKVTYAVQNITKEEIESVGYNYAPLEEVSKKYDIKKLKDGINIMDDGEEIFYISNPAVGLWASKDKFGF